MAELEPCPFCGGEAKLEHYYDTDGYLPMCSTEGCFGMIEKWFDTEEEAIEAWNRRISTIEPERKRGKWIKNDEREGWHCSCCDQDNVFAFRYNWNLEYEQQDNFCPNCGVDMREENYETD